jgi:diguanylate cyclase (GGDEF)-like protein
MICSDISTKINKLPTLPGIAMKILETIRQESPCVKDIAAIVASDTSLSAKVLQVANSPFYGRSDKIVSVHQAIAFLGLNEVKNMALGFSLIKTFTLKSKGAFDHVQFWKDSLVGATAAELLANKLDSRNSENAFCIGLMQNIGSLILAQSMPRQYEILMKEVLSNSVPLHRAESMRLGLNHMELGAHVLNTWGLPMPMVSAIGQHHLLEDGGVPLDEIEMLGMILALSSSVIDLFNGPDARTSYSRINQSIDACGLSKVIDAGSIVEATAEKIKAVFPLYELEVDENKHIEILETAKSELSALTTDLIRKNHIQTNSIQNLEEQAGTDGLTQVNNRRRLWEILSQEINRANLNGTTLSMIMADVDHFKSINDFFGHLAGDEALKNIASRLKKELREADNIARYGGEEFAIILPETTLDEAFSVAERLLKAIASTQILHNSKPVAVTLSLGVAALDQDCRMDAGGLIKRADDALYEAKNSGRNRCCCYTQRNSNNKAQNTILVIDDEEVVLVTVTGMLDRLGYDVIAARNAKEGVDLLVQSKHKIDLVILDMIMPEVSAKDIIATIKCECPKVKLVLSSGYTVDGSSDSHLLKSTDGFLPKPYLMSELSGVIQSTLWGGNPKAAVGQRSLAQPITPLE